MAKNIQLEATMMIYQSFVSFSNGTKAKAGNFINKIFALIGIAQPLFATCITNPFTLLSQFLSFLLRALSGEQPHTATMANNKENQPTLDAQTSKKANAPTKTTTAGTFTATAGSSGIPRAELLNYLRALMDVNCRLKLQLEDSEKEQNTLRDQLTESLAHQESLKSQLESVTEEHKKSLADQSKENKDLRDQIHQKADCIQELVDQFVRATQAQAPIGEWGEDDMDAVADEVAPICYALSNDDEEAGSG